MEEAAERAEDTSGEQAGRRAALLLALASSSIALTAVEGMDILYKSTLV